MSYDPVSGQKMEEELKKFRGYSEVKNGVKNRHFDFLFIRKACQRYDKYEYFKQSVGSIFMEFYWCWVVGYLQRFLPAWFARRVCHTSEERLLFEEKKERLPLKVSHGGKYRDSFFPLDTNIKRRLGHDFSITESGMDRGLSCRPFGSSFADDLRISFKNATKELDALRRQLKKTYGSSSARLDDEESESKSNLSCLLL